MLLIEDEEMLRSSMSRGIAKLSGVEVDDAGSLEEALTLIDRCPPDVIVSDIDLPRRSGLELLGELGQRRLQIPVIYASGYLTAYRSQIPQHADVDVMEKPVSLEELRSAIERRLSQSRSSMEIAPFSVPDYLQLACMGRHSVVVDVERAGQRLGEIVVWKGDVVSARDDSGVGDAALRRLAFMKGSGVRCRTLLERPTEQNLEGNWEWLLMEAARQADELGETADEWQPEQHSGVLRAGTPVDELDSLEPQAFEAEVPVEPELSPVEQAFNEAWDRGIEALLAKRYTVALLAFQEAGELNPEDPKVRANLKRLSDMGIVEPPAD
ncbi:MAG: response regulator [Polyangiaceae bacterium]|nr:response regulator [Polyangiaceae bacterium]MCB9607539.1 response regulator [Polyangiaceae bacterium]